MAQIYIPRAYVLRIKASIIGENELDGIRMSSVVNVGSFDLMDRLADWCRAFDRHKIDYHLSTRYHVFDVWPTRAIKPDFSPSEEDGEPEAVADALLEIIPANYIAAEEKRIGSPINMWTQFR